MAADASGDRPFRGWLEIVGFRDYRVLFQDSDAWSDGTGDSVVHERVRGVRARSDLHPLLLIRVEFELRINFFDFVSSISGNRRFQLENVRMEIGLDASVAVQIGTRWRTHGCNNCNASRPQPMHGSKRIVKTNKKREIEKLGLYVYLNATLPVQFDNNK